MVVWRTLGRPALAWIVAVALLGLSAPSRAISLISTLPADSTTSFQAGGVDISDNDYHAVSFTTDARSYTLDSVVLSLSGYNQFGGLTVRFRADSAEAPGSGLEQIADPGGIPSGTTPADVTFAAAGTTTLAPSTTYWVEFFANSLTGVAQWHATQGSTSGPATLGSRAVSPVDQGVTWSPASGIPAFQVNATVVPEAGTALLVGGGLAALGALRRRRR